MQNKFFSALVAICISGTLMVSCTETPKTDPMADTSTAKMEPTKPMEEAGVMVGGANMVPSKNIVENAAGSADHTTLVAAVKAADLAATLSGPGPFTVFAP
ncbi:MAG: fasciclin domain-containing protein, partial [Chitinophagaceae bacterium]